MIRPAHSFRRRLAVAAVAIGLASIGPITASLEAGAAPAGAPGSALGAVNVHAVAVGLRFPAYSHQGEDAEAELPYALADIGGGGVSHALTSVFWPGPTGGALGSTLGVLAGDKVPASLIKLLNDPIKAEAPTVNGVTKVSMSKPGLIMEALATPEHTASSSALGLTNLSSLGHNSGPLISAATDITFKGADTVVADATTALTDIAVGPLHIGSITSTAHATSNGKHADGATSTKITDATIAGVGITIGQDGIELAKASILPASVIDTLNKTINSTLKAAGIKIYLTKGSKIANGSQISLQSGALFITLAKAGYKSGVNDTGMLLQLGGASITANATEGYVPPVIPTPATTQPTTSDGGGVPGIVSPPDLGTGTQVLPPTTAPAPQLAADQLSLPGALSSWWIVLGVALAAFFALGLSMLPSRALAAGVSCRLEEEL